MSSQPPADIVYTLSKIEYLYNAPEEDILSPNVSELVGESAFRRLMREHGKELRSKSALPRLVIKLPADQITPDLEARVSDGIQRYAISTINDNRLLLHKHRINGWRQTLRGMVFLGICLTIAFGFTFVQEPHLAYTVAQILVQGFTVIGWVGLWHPVEILLFDWIPYRQENYMLKHLQNVQVKIVAQS